MFKSGDLVWISSESYQLYSASGSLYLRESVREKIHINEIALYVKIDKYLIVVLTRYGLRRVDPEFIRSINE